MTLVRIFMHHTSSTIVSSKGINLQKIIFLTFLKLMVIFIHMKDLYILQA